MRVFLTGATGFIGSRIVPELLAAGHTVLGLTRSDAGAGVLAAQGAEVRRGTLEDVATLRAGTEQADAVIHTAFDHDFANFAANCDKDRRAIEAMGDVLKGSGRPILITSGTGFGTPDDGHLATEDVFNPHHPNPRIASELAGQALLDAGVDLRVVRLPQVHDTVKQGLITPLLDIFRASGVVAYVGDGANRWPAAPVSDVARLYVRALDHGARGARYHAVAEEGITARTIAETLGAGLGVPVRSVTPAEAPQYFGWMTMFAALDMPASSAWTRERLDWHPTGPSLLTDLQGMDYTLAAAA